MNKLDITQLLKGNPYPGRGIVLGRSADDKEARRGEGIPHELDAGCGV